MALIFFISLLFSVSVSIDAMKQSSLHRKPNKDFSVGDFRRNQHQYLWAKKVTSSAVADNIDCAFLCVGEPKCFSFNMAVEPDSKSLYLCELLSTDKYTTTEKLHPNGSYHHYSPWSPCESGPCQNGAVCVPDFEANSYHCDCKPGFVGNSCECRASYLGKTCSHVKSIYPASLSGLYLIDPDNVGSVTPPFCVHCDMSDKNAVGVTVISHDSEATTRVTGYDPAGSYSLDVHYIGASPAQLANLIDQSANCEQYIKYACYHSRLLWDRKPFGWWVSRDDLRMKYWGGVTTGDYKCACAINNTCANPRYGCNCDANDHKWREDSGLLTNKSHLPVSQLRFGDTGNGEYGKHTLGKLKCYGIAGP